MLLMGEQSLLMFGHGYNYATTLEGAFKVKEVELMHSKGILACEMKHGRKIHDYVIKSGFQSEEGKRIPTPESQEEKDGDNLCW